MRKARVKEVVEQMKINNNFEDMDRMLAAPSGAASVPVGAANRARSDDCEAQARAAARPAGRPRVLWPRAPRRAAEERAAGRAGESRHAAT